MAQFKAEAGKTYINPETGQKVSFTAEELESPAVGFLSDQFQVDAPTPQPTPQESTTPIDSSTETSPFFGIPTEVSNQLPTEESAQQFQQAVQQGETQETALKQATGTTSQIPDLQGTQISNEADLQAKREELTAAGVDPGDFSKFITSPDEQGRLFFRQPATLTSPTGEKRVVATGSEEASKLLSSGFTLGDRFDDKLIESQTMVEEPPIDIQKTNDPNAFASETAAANAAAYSKSVDEEVNRLYQLLSGFESEEKTQLNELFDQFTEATDALTGRGEMQRKEEEKRQIEEKAQRLARKNTELKAKLAEINALTASYQAENAAEATRPQTLSRLRGSEAANYRNYIAQKNLLTSEASFIQAEVLGLQGEVQAAQNAADRAVELEFMDRESRANALLSQISILQDRVSKDEANYTRAVGLALEQEQQRIAEAKQAKREIANVMISAFEAGINDPAVISRIKNAKSRTEALEILGQNLPEQQDLPSISEQLAADKAGFDIVDGKIVSQQRTGQTVTDASGSTFDIGTYATDPNHEARVQSILDNMGQMTSVEQMNDYIQSVAPGSPVTGQMIANASEKFGTSWETMMAIMQQDSSFGTAGKGARTFNPGNVGNTDSGAEVDYGSWQAGVDAVAKNLAGRKVDSNLDITQFSSIVDQAAQLAGAEDQRESTRNIIENALSNGDFVTAYAQIANNVEEGLTGTVKTRFANARTDYNVMAGMADAIQQYVNAGGDTGFLKGKAEDVAQRFGQIANSNDPEFAALGAQLQREFQTYRNIMTGAAFTPKESREYEKVNPTTGKSLDLNLAVIQGALNQLENRIVSTIETRVPGATEKIYSQIPGAQTQSPDTLEQLGVSQEQQNLFSEVVSQGSSKDDDDEGGFWTGFLNSLGF